MTSRSSNGPTPPHYAERRNVRAFDPGGARRLAREAGVEGEAPPGRAADAGVALVAPMGV